MQEVDTHVYCIEYHSTEEVSNCITLQNFLYCTATIEKAAMHNVASKIRKCPHRPIFSASSSCCMNL